MTICIDSMPDFSFSTLNSLSVSFIIRLFFGSIIVDICLLVQFGNLSLFHLCHG